MSLQVVWDSRWTKDSYRLLTRIFLENNSIMTKAYVLMAMKPQDEKDMTDREKSQKWRLRRLSKMMEDKTSDVSTEEESEEKKPNSPNGRKLIKDATCSRISKEKTQIPDNQCSFKSSNVNEQTNEGISLKSTNSRSSFESTNGRPSFDSASYNGRPSFGSTNGRASFRMTNGRSSFPYDQNSRYNSSSTVSYRSPNMTSRTVGRIPSENSAFRTVKMSQGTVHWSDDDVFTEDTRYVNGSRDQFNNDVTNGTASSGATNGMTSNLRHRPQTTSSEVRPKISDFTLLTLMLIIFPFVVIAIS